MAQGRQSYRIASTFDSEPFRKEARILRKLAEELELCTLSLNLVRQGWEALQPESYRGFRKSGDQVAAIYAALHSSSLDRHPNGQSLIHYGST